MGYGVVCDHWWGEIFDGIGAHPLSREIYMAKVSSDISGLEGQ